MPALSTQPATFRKQLEVPIEPCLPQKRTLSASCAVCTCDVLNFIFVKPLGQQKNLLQNPRIQQIVEASAGILVGSLKPGSTLEHSCTNRDVV